MQKFKAGDKVRIINYGHLVWQVGGGKEISWVDISPELVGKQATVDGSYADFIELGKPNFLGHRNEQNEKQYALLGVSKHAWYNEEQLELIEYEPDYRESDQE